MTPTHAISADEARRLAEDKRKLLTQGEREIILSRIRDLQATLEEDNRRRGYTS